MNKQAQFDFFETSAEALRGSYLPGVEAGRAAVESGLSIATRLAAVRQSLQMAASKLPADETAAHHVARAIGYLDGWAGGK